MNQSTICSTVLTTGIAFFAVLAPTQRCFGPAVSSATSPGMPDSSANNGKFVRVANAG